MRRATGSPVPAFIAGSLPAAVRMLGLAAYHSVRGPLAFTTSHWRIDTLAAHFLRLLEALYCHALKHTAWIIRVVRRTFDGDAVMEARFVPRVHRREKPRRPQSSSKTSIAASLTSPKGRTV